MKQLWTKLSTRIDARSLRERIMLFAAALGLVVFAATSLVLGPLFNKQQQLATTIEQQQSAIVQMEGQMNQMARSAQLDPDAPTRARIAEVKGEIDRLGTELRTMQESLVPPERIAPLLETMLRANGRLRLVSLRTLPVTGLSEAMPPAAAPVATGVIADALPSDAARIAADTTAVKAAAQAVAPVAGKPPELVYRHGVELTLEGRYLDMVNYLNALESMPVRLIWGTARLDAREHTQARLTLTLFTLSLEKDWMKL